MDPADNIFTFPKDSVEQNFEDSKDAVAHLIELYQTAADFLCAKFVSVLETGDSSTRYRAYYPEVRITTTELCLGRQPPVFWACLRPWHLCHYHHPSGVVPILS